MQKKQKTPLLSFILSISLLFIQTSCTPLFNKSSQNGANSKNQIKLDAQDLPWFNVKAPLTDEQLRGKLVILDFWTFCCINCIHVIPTLKKIEKRFPNEVLIIGVHSPKFKNEGDDDELKNAIMRYELKHPIIQDVGFKLWNKFDVHAWPTLMFISPTGQSLGKFSGEPDPDRLISTIAKWVEKYKASGSLNGSASSLTSTENYIKENQRNKQLSFPAKIDFDPKNKLFAISDSNHNQIVIANESGEIIERIGSGEIGRKDGDYQSASFYRPQGIKIQRNIVWVADTENHLIRKVDLKKKQVYTIAGTGRQGDVLGAIESDPLKTAISSPWDVEIIGSDLYFANAGTHQLGVVYNAVDPKGSDQKMYLSRFAGNGREAIVDGMRLEASLAQPSGLWFNGKSKLFFVDSETSSIRAVNLKTDKVITYIGTGLFDFGDQDGFGVKARFKQKALLQHPIGLAYGDKKIYIADSYNHKVKVLNLKTQEVKSLKFQGKLSEPAGLCFVNEDDSKYLYIADTNNHRVLKVDLSTDNSEVFI